LRGGCGGGGLVVKINTFGDGLTRRGITGCGGARVKLVGCSCLRERDARAKVSHKEPSHPAACVCVFHFRDRVRACVKIRDTSVNRAECGGWTEGVTKG